MTTEAPYHNRPPEIAAIRQLVKGTYDLQQLRMQEGLRVVAQYKARLGQQPGSKETELDPEAQQILKDLKAEHKRLADAMKKAPRNERFKNNKLISNEAEFCLIEWYEELDTQEKRQFQQLGKILKGHRLWSDYLEGVKGVGPAMAGVILSEFDIRDYYIDSNFRRVSPDHPGARLKRLYVSSLWRYAGLDVVADGRGRSRRKEHLIDVEYADKDGKPQTRKSVTFNPFLKTKMTGVLAPSFLKQKGSPYRDIYDEYKHRLESHAQHGIHNDGKKDDDGKQLASKGHRHNMAMRYMVKMFLKDLYINWRKIEGLEVYPSYQEAKLGHKHDAA